MTDKTPKVFLPVMVEPETKAWVERAAANRKTSRAAIVRAALAAYARLHPSLGSDYGDGAEALPDKNEYPAYSGLGYTGPVPGAKVAS